MSTRALHLPCNNAIILDCSKLGSRSPQLIQASDDRDFNLNPHTEFSPVALTSQDPFEAYIKRDFYNFSAPANLSPPQPVHTDRPISETLRTKIVVGPPRYQVHQQPTES